MAVSPNPPDVDRAEEQRSGDVMFNRILDTLSEQFQLVHRNHDAICQLVQERHDRLSEQMSYLLDLYEVEQRGQKETNSHWNQTVENIIREPTLLTGDVLSGAQDVSHSNRTTGLSVEEHVTSGSVCSKAHKWQSSLSVTAAYSRSDNQLLSRRKTIFEAVMGFLIIINCTLIFGQLEFAGIKGGQSLGYGAGNDIDFEALNRVFELLSEAVSIIFLLELAMRIYWARWRFLTFSNLVDAVIVIISALDTLVMRLGNVTFMRLFRVFRLLRTLKVVRVITYFRQLRVLVVSIYSSFLSFFWSMAIMLLLMLFGALCKTQILQNVITDERVDLQLREWLYVHYGTSSRALFTMFEASFSGGWPGVARRVIEDVSPYWAAFWVCYAAVVVFAVVRIISALFLKDTLANAGMDANTMIDDQLRGSRSYVRKLVDLIEAIDPKHIGMLTYDEFMVVVDEPRTKAWLAALEITAIDARTLWDLLEKCNDTLITEEEFVNGIMKIKGVARSHDMKLLKNENSKIYAQCTAVSRSCNEIRHQLDVVLSTLALGAAKHSLHAAAGSGGDSSKPPMVREYSDSLPWSIL